MLGWWPWYLVPEDNEREGEKTKKRVIFFGLIFQCVKCLKHPKKSCASHMILSMSLLMAKVNGRVNIDTL